MERAKGFEPPGAVHGPARKPRFADVRKEKNGAGEGIRTLDPDLGKVVLYH
jgi:hypothetical protein